MDIRTQLWAYSPTSEYLSGASDGGSVHDTLLEWRDDGVPEPTEQDLAAAQASLEAAGADPIAISVDTAEIAGDGEDVATLTVTYRLPYPPTVAVLINGEPYPVDVSTGQGALEIVSDTPGAAIVVETERLYEGYASQAEPIIIEVV